jgi:pyroglutamyl-peptidase
MTHKIRILLTGFEPFGGSRINPSEQVVGALANVELPGIHLRTAILPVDRLRGPQALLDLLKLKRFAPQAVVCLGEAPRRAVISIERVAVNLMDYRIPDNAGQQVQDEPVIPGGPAAYFSTLPVRAMLETLLRYGIPAELSLSAGTFLCNQIMYTLLHTLAQQGSSIPAGFVHLPMLPAEAASAPSPAPSMSFELSFNAVIKLLDVVRSSLSGVES